METTDCGAVALGIILAYYRCFVPLDELRHECGVSRDGIKPAHLIKAAQRYGLITHVTNQSPESIRRLTYPVILLWKRRHFVVLEGFKGNKVYINDPNSGRSTLDWPIFLQGFSGITIQMTPDERFEKRKKPRLLLSECHRLVRTERSSLFFIFLSSLLLTIPTLITPVFSKIYIDQYIIQGQVDWLTPLCLVMLIFMSIQFTLMYLQRMILRRFEAKYAVVLAAQLIRKLIYSPMIFFARRKAGDLSSRLQVSDRFSESIAGPICSAAVGIIQIMAYLTLMFCYNTLISVLAFGIIFVLLTSFSLFQAKRRELSFITKQNMRDLTSTTLSHLTNIQQIKATGRNTFFLDVWQQQLIQYLKSYQHLSFLNLTNSSITLLIASFGSIAILWLGALMSLRGTITIGELIACNTLFLSLNEPTLQLLNLNNQRHQIQADYSRIMDISQEQSEPIEMHQNTEMHSIKGKIELINLTFGYSRLEKPLFQALSLVIEPGSKVGIIGASGSGKSTLAHLIAGLYTPWSGTILIDGIPLESIPTEKRAIFMAIVSQDQFFFKGSVKDNLCLWDYHYSTQDLLKATHAACIDDILDAQLTEGASNLSGGQRQRLELARALLIKPSILILDEATSALDPLTEQKINENIYNYNATTLHIAHRFNTIKNADMIFILNNGHLSDSGSPNELLARKSTAYLELLNEYNTELV